MMALYKQFSQGVTVALCATMSASTLGYMMLDSHKIERKQIITQYEKQIKVLLSDNEKLNLEINKLKSNK